MNQSPTGGPVEALFSRRAIAAICAETLEHHPNETGGILLGHFRQNRWQVLEAIDPGPGARCTPHTFSYDQTYVSHLASKLARQYRTPLELIGLWHRHPGSLDRFSHDDVITNRRFAERSIHGALSCLVNLDPQFRITAYHIPLDRHPCRLPVWVGDALIDGELRDQLNADDVDGGDLQQTALTRQLQALFERHPRAAAPLGHALTAALEPLLERLESQQRWVYALKACDQILQLALISCDGVSAQLWELGSGTAGELLVWGLRGETMSTEQFARCVLEGQGHGR